MVVVYKNSTFQFLVFKFTQRIEQSRNKNTLSKKNFKPVHCVAFERFPFALQRQYHSVPTNSSGRGVDSFLNPGGWQ